MARTRNFADVLRKELAADPALAKRVSEEWFNADIAQKVYDARTGAGLTQKKLAERCGTRQSVISRIEDADYDGHSLGLLKRIAEALGRTLRVEMCGQSHAANGKPKATPMKKRIRKTAAKTAQR